MYVALLAVLLGTTAWLAFGGFRDGSRARLALGVALGVATAAFFGSLTFWGEMLWFDALGYGERFWSAVGYEAGATVAGALLAGLLAFLLVLAVRDRRLRFGAAAIGTVAGALWGYGAWDVILRFLHRVPAGIDEPILGLDAGFYLFTLPLLDSLFALALTCTLIAAGAAALFTVLRSAEHVGEVIELRRRQGLTVHPAASRELDDGAIQSALGRTLAAVAIVLALGRLLAIPHLLFSSWGAVSGPGWTDVHVRLPALLLVAAVTATFGGLLAFRGARRRFAGWATRFGTPWRLSVAAGLMAPAAVVAALWILALGVVPALIQRFWVEPNEISFEAPYIAHNIALTHHGFGLDRIEEREYPATGAFDAAVARENREVLEEARLWDWRALDAVYRQFQEIRLYYEFVDVDIDRYHVGGDYRQVMVSAREMEVDNLPAQSQTFVNRHFKYTHGYGLTMAPVAEFTPEGLPHLLVKDLPPVSEVPELSVERPQIYYGELTDAHAYVNTTEEEFDYPSGDENVTIRYPGRGGVQLSSLWRRFVVGWMFDGTRLFLSEYPTADSRVMFHRRVRDRIARVAPFLVQDDDPYVVLANGRLYWIVDAYTTSSYLPYSEPFSSIERIGLNPSEGSAQATQLASRVVPQLDGARYVRNSVKAVVDAFDGTVDLYVFDPDDPLIRVWGSIFPGLFKPREAMPEALASHVRYPADLFLAQGLVYAKYHMTDPRVFYNQEDLWVRATEKYYDQVRPVDPYFVMWQPPGAPAGSVQFTSIQPFTPKSRQVMIGWIAGLSDGENYGRLLAYKFPKDRRVLGPQQVETKIDQDRYLSQQLSLWDQRGSRVIRGNVLALPIGDTLLYVEPIYLQAETAAYPELRLVVLMHGDDLAYGQSLEEALAQLVGEEVELPELHLGEPAARPRQASPEGAPRMVQPETGPAPALAALPPDVRALAREADRAFQRYLELQAERRFTEAAAELERLGEILDRLATGDEAPPAPP
jgi:hypothetical protein